MNLNWAMIEIVVLSTVLTGCGQYSQSYSKLEQQQMARLTGGGDAEAGRHSIREKGCITCHTLDSVPGARGLIGPSLDGIADRSYIAGHLPNTPDNMILWIEHPHQIVPQTVMPEMGLTEQESKNIAAYLYTQHGRE